MQNAAIAYIFIYQKIFDLVNLKLKITAIDAMLPSEDYIMLIQTKHKRGGP